MLKTGLAELALGFGRVLKKWRCFGQNQRGQAPQNGRKQLASPEIITWLQTPVGHDAMEPVALSRCHSSRAQWRRPVLGSCVLREEGIVASNCPATTSSAVLVRFSQRSSLLVCAWVGAAVLGREE